MGLQNQAALPAGDWQVQISYQYANANQFFVGDRRRDDLAPFGKPPLRKVSIVRADVVYGVSDRLSLGVTVPYLQGSGGFEQGTQQSHQFYGYKAKGLGDISLQGEYWLSDPTKRSRVSGSVALGIKAPTGADDLKGEFNGGVIRPIDEAFQLGNGGWEILLKAQGTAKVRGNLFAYGSGYYGISLSSHTDIVQGGAFRAVPDTYSGRLGATYLLVAPKGVALSAGGLINGVTVRDLIGGGDLYWRRARLRSLRRARNRVDRGPHFGLSERSDSRVPE